MKKVTLLHGPPEQFGERVYPLSACQIKILSLLRRVKGTLSRKQIIKKTGVHLTQVNCWGIGISNPTKRVIYEAKSKIPSLLTMKLVKEVKIPRPDSNSSVGEKRYLITRLGREVYKHSKLVAA